MVITTKFKLSLVTVAAVLGALAGQANGAGVWGEPVQASFAAGAQNASPDAFLSDVSCWSAGNCVAVGAFSNATGDKEAFTMTMTSGVWGTSRPAVFAAGVQNTNPYAVFNSVSCVSAGNCVAGGSFTNAAGDVEAFTMTLSSGVWATARPLEFAAGVQSTSPNGAIRSVSCASAGNCVASGTFKNAAGFYEAFTMTLSSGVWATARPAVFAAGVQNTREEANLLSVSCVSAGNCVAVGSFLNAASDYEAFTMTLSSGVWGTSRPAVFAAGVQNSSPEDNLYSVSCTSAGNCVASGTFKNAAGDFEAFTMTLSSGVWATARPAVFAAGVQNASPDASFSDVSCPSAGNCVASGSFENAAGNYEAFTMTLSSGVWATARPAVFAAGVQNTNSSDVFNSVTCPSAKSCVAVGRFKNSVGGYEAIAMTYVDNSVAPTTTIAPTTTVASGLPSTGSHSDGLLVVALVAVFTGLMVMAGRRRLIN